jgi:autophagy-related protein 2
MGFYIPSFIQKRILRYALSKFDVLDTDALGLESLDIAWGKRSTLELRDVALRRDVSSFPTYDMC